MSDVAIEGQGVDHLPWEEEYYAPPRPGEYRAFSRKLAPALTAAGGVLTVIGALGTWIRELEVAETGTSKDITAVMGYGQSTGRLLAAFGVLAVIGAFLWFLYRPTVKLVSIGASVIAIVMIAVRLATLDGSAKSLADRLVKVAAAKNVAGSFIYHAGFGWGAWVLFAAAILLTLGLVTGILRELDLRKGFPE